MSRLCIPPDQADAFIKEILKGNVKVSDLIKMDTAPRLEEFKKFFGKDADSVNRLFESKQVLEYQQRGIENWIAEIGQTGRYDPQKKAKMEAKKLELKKAKLERILSPKEEEGFLSSFAEIHYGVEVAREQSIEAFKLDMAAKDLLQKAKVAKDSKGNPIVNEKGVQTLDWENSRDRLDYGTAAWTTQKYVDGLKEENFAMKDLWGKQWQKFKETGRNEGKDSQWGKAVAQVIGRFMTNVRNVSISLVASIDNSFLGRQGMATLGTRPDIWAKMALKSFDDIFTVMTNRHGKQIAVDAIMADVYSRPNFMNGNYELAELIPKNEEQYPSSAPERLANIGSKNKKLDFVAGLARVPGRMFESSQIAFTNSAIRIRIETFDRLLKAAEKGGKDITDEVLIKDIGSVVNSLSARGKTGKVLDSVIAKNLFWAPKMLMANMNLITAHGFGKGLETNFAKKEALKNAFLINFEPVIVAAILNALSSGDPLSGDVVDMDMSSPSFMDIRVGKTTFDITGGRGSLYTLLGRAAYWLMGKGIKTGAGKYKQLNTGEYGGKDAFDVMIDFLVNKTPPVTRAAIDGLKGLDFYGNEVDFTNTLMKVGVPISIGNFNNNINGQASQQEVEAVVGSFLDVLGVGSTTYTDWGSSANKSKKANYTNKYEGKYNSNYSNKYTNKY